MYYSPSFLLTFPETLFIPPPSQFRPLLLIFLIFLPIVSSFLLVCLDVKNIRSQYARHRLNKGRQKVY